MPATVIVNDRDLVITKTIDMVFVAKKTGVVDQKLADFVFPIGEHQATGMTLIGKIQTVVVVTIETAGMVVDHVQDHRQAVNMANVDKHLELIDLTLQVCLGQGFATAFGEQFIDND